MKTEQKMARDLCAGDRTEWYTVLNDAHQPPGSNRVWCNVKYYGEDPGMERRVWRADQVIIVQVVDTDKYRLAVCLLDGVGLGKDFTLNEAKVRAWCACAHYILGELYSPAELETMRASL